MKSAAKHQLVVTTSGLPALTAGKVYQLWLIGTHGNKIRFEGLLAPRATATAGRCSSPACSRATSSA